MIQEVHRSVTPIYLSAAVWLIASLFFPMLHLYQYLIYLALAAAAYAAGRKFFPDQVTYTEAPEKAPDSGDPEVDAMLTEARIKRRELDEFGRGAESETVRIRTETLAALTDRILAALEQDPARVNRARKFLDYYLPSTVRLLERYRELEGQNVKGPNITASMEKITEMLGTVREAFQRQLDSLYQADAMDISADITVMEQLMRAEGLLEEV